MAVRVQGCRDCMKGVQVHTMFIIIRRQQKLYSSYVDELKGVLCRR